MADTRTFNQLDMEHIALSIEHNVLKADDVETLKAVRETPWKAYLLELCPSIRPEGISADSRGPSRSVLEAMEALGLVFEEKAVDAAGSKVKEEFPEEK